MAEAIKNRYEFVILFDVENGRDRYAREIIRYVLEKEQIGQQEMKEGQVNV